MRISDWSSDVCSSDLSTAESLDSLGNQHALTGSHHGQGVVLGREAGQLGTLTKICHTTLLELEERDTVQLAQPDLPRDEVPELPDTLVVDGPDQEVQGNRGHLLELVQDGLDAVS